MDGEWLTVPDGDTTWKVDAEFLSSNWTCIWDRGCAGIEAQADVEAQLGCCSVGAQMLDADEAMMIAALAMTLETEHAQFAGHIAAGGALNDDMTNTRVVDGACIFLNRPGFAGGEGCALHAEAVRSDDSPIDWKPSVCWQLPIKVERSTEGDSTLATLRAWSRADWGPDGETMAYCCTEGPDATGNAPSDAFVGDRPVIESLREELVALMGETVVDSIAVDLSTRKTKESGRD